MTAVERGLHVAEIDATSDTAISQTSLSKISITTSLYQDVKVNAPDPS